MNEYLKSILNVATCGDCVEVMKKIPENSINLIVTSPPYNVGIKYDVYKDDELTMEQYFEWCSVWLKECYRVLASDGRIALNVLNEANVKGQGRFMMSAEFYHIMRKIGFNFFGLVDLTEDTPHRVKLTSWGSWLSSSGPYIYNPKECVLLFYKEKHIRERPGISWMPVGEEMITDPESGKVRKKLLYTDEQKNEFKDLVFALWKYTAEKQCLTKACFSPDIPRNAIKILSYENDIVLDPFGGSGTTALMAEVLYRQWISIDISQNYTDVTNQRVRQWRWGKKEINLSNSEMVKGIHTISSSVISKSLSK